jgi:hypothetical protein
MLLLEAAEPARILLLEAAEPTGTEADEVTHRNRGLPLMNVHHELGNIALESGETQTARTHFQEQLEVARQLSHPSQEGSALACLGIVALSEGDTDAATAHLVDALRLALELRQTDVIFNECLLPLAEVALRRNELARAARLLGATDAARERAGWQLDRGDQDRYDRVMAALGDDDTLQAALAQGRATDVDDVVAYALGESRGVRDP